MKLNTRQVADKLNCSIGTVGKLIRDGKLKDLGTIKEGAKKHYMLVDSKELSEFSKIYKNRKSHSLVTSQPTKIETQTNNPTGLITRLERIEDKLDQLIRMWN